MSTEKLRRMVKRWTTKDLAEALSGKFGKFYAHELAIIREEQDRRWWGWKA